MQSYAAHLARELHINPKPVRGKSIVPMLKTDAKELLAAYDALASAIRNKQTVSPAAEWFVDNFYIVEDQLREIRLSLPRNYYNELPKLAEGKLKDYPRVYAIALAIIAHTDSRLDVESLRRFTQAFQQVTPLQIGELWALPITLRIALVEHLKPLTQRIVSARQNRADADLLADRLLQQVSLVDVEPDDLVRMLELELGDPKNYDRAFITQLIQRLRDQDPNVWPAFNWLEQQLQSFHNTNTQQVIELDHYRQAAAQLTVGNIITSMRLLSTVDWRDFFETISVVDPILARDPAGAYLRMDFATRDRYRHAVERIARHSRGTEMQVAEAAVKLASEATKAQAPERERHIGFYLIDQGARRIEALYRYRPRVRDYMARFSFRFATFLYLSTFAVVALGFVAAALGYLHSQGAPTWQLVLAGVVAFWPLGQLALNMLNHYVTTFAKPRNLPKIETDKGIPADATTMVVVPTLFTSEATVRGLLENLQIHFLGNQEDNIYFALLGDFADAATEKTEHDDILLKIAQDGIDELNARHCKTSEKRFFLFLRKRQFNRPEGKWIGWERKRGKIHEFNRLLRGDKNTSYTVATAPAGLLGKVKYVITLDSDTQLPRDGARQLIGTIVHPLNQPHFDAKLGRVTAGYGILQPRVSIELTSSYRSRFARVFSGNTGQDPYTTAVSDVYQDLFFEGSFTGKGLYVVDAFEASLKDRVPENTLLSHDLFEGSYARSALVTDIELFDEYPSNYRAFAKRAHRWTRGDWQIAQWVLPWTPSANGKLARNVLPIISRWKLFDNLRRSLVAPAVVLQLLLAWTILPGSPLLNSLPALLVFLFPLFPLATVSFVRRPAGVPWKAHLLKMFSETELLLSQAVCEIAFVLDQAINQVDAVVRTLHRMFVSRKLMLEWMSFAQVESMRQESVFLAATSVVSALMAVAIAIVRPGALLVGAPFLITWCANPLLERWLKTKPKNKEKALEAHEIADFRRYARRTWHFFETFVGPDDHWLAPDNFQEDPIPVVAHRTSPTNIGLQFLATSTAYDFGYLGYLEFIERLELTMASLLKLERSHGHFLNWYNTLTLEPLRPQYISTVDSGNLAGHLLTLKQICLEHFNAPVIHPRAREGLTQTLLELDAAVRNIEELAHAGGAITLKELQRTVGQAVEHTQNFQWHTVSEWKDFLNSLTEQLNNTRDLLDTLGTDTPPSKLADIRDWLNCATHHVTEFQRDIEISGPFLDSPAHNAAILFRQREIAERAEQLALEMDFRFLFDETRKIFVIGYNVADSRRDNSHYDLLASESRLASFIAIAKGDVPQEHWFRLGRKMTPVSTGRALISWTATMFEYMMPMLVMRRYADTLLDQTYLSVVDRQIEYGKQQGVPWGISEAGFNARDLQMNYQYGPFGVPGLGLKRGLSDELVISPYSSMLAAQVNPHAAHANLKRLELQGAFSRFGFFESIDYTAERLPKGQKYFLLQSFMAHHQGMSLVSLNNILNDNVMQRRFHHDPLVHATQLILQERIPNAVTITRPRAEEVRIDSLLRFSSNPTPRVYTKLHHSSPKVQILSNGVYSTLVSSGGAGYSKCADRALSRWREDVTCDNWGQFFYVRNKNNGKIWSSGYQPYKTVPKEYEITFNEDKVDILRRDESITTHTEIIVSPEDNVELRRLSLTNHGHEEREIEITSFMEVVLARMQDDAAHPAFSNLFVQTESVPEHDALFATRRRRSKSEEEVFGFHLVATDAKVSGSLQFETDRTRFVGRGHNAAKPRAIVENSPLSNTVGAVLDPIFSLRRTLVIPAGETARITFATGLAYSREEAQRMVEKYHDVHIFNREAELAWTKSQVQLRHLNIPIEKAHIYQRLAGKVAYLDPTLRPKSHALSQNKKTQSSLWAYGISGDLPIILTRIVDEKGMALVRDLLHAHEYLRMKGLTVDLVILNERPPSYLQALQEELQRQIRMSASHSLLDKPGGIFVRRTDIMPAEDVLLLKSVARVSLDADHGTLDEQLKRVYTDLELPKNFSPSASPHKYTDDAPQLPELDFFNGLGGFSRDGREYVIQLTEGQWTPAPWINVVANNREFGFLISESGSGYSWSENSRENRITPWSNDPVSDPSGETIYVRDDETGEIWTPTPLPIREKESYLVRHGQGYSAFEHNSHGINLELLCFVPLDQPVKISRLRIKNTTGHARKLSVTSFTEWVLGIHRSASSAHVVTSVDEATQAIFAHNAYNNEFASRIAFADINDANRKFTCDRKEFIGRNRDHRDPAALRRAGLSGNSGAGLDPCAALQSSFELAPNEEREILILLGQGGDTDEARQIVARFRESQNVQKALDEVVSYWDEMLGTIVVKTPDQAMNLITNRWLLYQTLACRVWARTAFYQSGGAYGFRDQLQDVMALVYSRPDIARSQILRAAGHQFKEGDVQHWWHPPTGRGVRTRFSDDLLWLPYVTSFYIGVTGDRTILNEVVSFIEAPTLKEGEDDSYRQPDASSESATVLDHCFRALDRSLKTGEHGLPLMGSGDWNDGMNLVGNHGKGESVWVGWFLHKTITQMLPYCDPEHTATYRDHLQKLKTAIEKNAWDGDWYRRAYFDNGKVLGSASNDECRIDSIAQSWAVFSGVAEPDRAARAMSSVNEYLVNREDGLIKLFTPPFDKGSLDPGYIKGYLPGVRENGGQYTHAAIWTLMAFAQLGDGNRAVELFALINPIHHTSSRATLHRYKVEPYVIAADVYGLSPYMGRGGWTWYTGSASWMYRAVIETILGFDLRGDQLVMQPRIPRHWSGFEMTYRHGKSPYHIKVSGAATTHAWRVELDGKVLETPQIPLKDDGLEHRVHIFY